MLSVAIQLNCSSVGDSIEGALGEDHGRVGFPPGQKLLRWFHTGPLVFTRSPSLKTRGSLASELVVLDVKLVGEIELTGLDWTDPSSSYENDNYVCKKKTMSIA